jgi:F0F1-type ATP synthase membrane subunit c/vacuolar-type H+-ATPase subunit K
MVKVRFDMKKTRIANPLRAAAAMMLLVALGCMIPSSGTAPAGGNGLEGAGTTPVARGMLIPARMRLMVRYSPSRTA